ncbi:3'-5' exonuclease [Sedimentisphaera salicampi]|uniref:3'-5' exonuclease n=1 Tax=Sedimentisphaera salicampi TaxID=1941349 RepID=UPI000B9C7909|nr:3'-5' exonuclease [Sedimentisphaera salicampi]OXU14550.1 Exodeoxyribonuclease 10 [Sedimentisphaera salicampi]
MGMNFVAIDFETANESRDSACAVGLVRVENSKVVSKVCRLINPDTYFSSYNIAVHGITESDVVNEPTFDEVWEELKPALAGANFFVAHNAPFDKSVLTRCCEKYNMELPQKEFVCTVQVARKLWDIRPATLPDVCDRLNIELNHHEALSDANACAEIMIAAIQEGYQV